MKYKITNSWEIAVLAPLLLLKLVVVFWSVNKGFDFTDEGTFMIYYEFMGYYEHVHSYIHILIRRIFFFLEPDIISYRVLRIFFELATLGFFTYGFHSWGSSGRSPVANYMPSFPFLFLFVGLGAFLSLYCRVIYYDYLTNFFVLTACGAFFYALAFAKDFESNKRKVLIALLFAGFCIGIEVFIKLPSALLVFIFLLAGAFFLTPKDIWKYTLSSLTMGTLAGLIFFALLSGDPVWLINDYIGAAEESELMGYTDTHYFYLLYVQHDLRYFLTFVAPPLAVFLILFLLSRKWRNTNVQTNKSDLALAIAIAVSVLTFAVAYWMYDDKQYEDLFYKEVSFSGLYLIYLFILIIFMLLIAAVYMIYQNTGSEKRREWLEVSIVALFLIILPYLMLAGTNTSLVKGIYAYVLPWLFLLGLLLGYIRKRFELKATYTLIFLITVGLSQYLFIHYYVYHPFRLLAPLTEQTVPLKADPRIKTDKATANFLNEVQDILASNGFKNGDPILALTEMPGVVYLMKGYSPGTISYHHWGGALDFSCYHLKRLDAAMADELFMLINYKTPGMFFECLKESGIDFDNNFEIVGRVWNPHAQDETLVLRSR